jgi:membrane-associated protein
MVMAGHWLGKIFPDLPDYLELIVIGMILISAVPVAITWWRAKRNSDLRDLKDKASGNSK